MRLHGDVCIEVIQGAVSFLTAIPATLVHSFDFFVPSTWSLLLVGAGNGHKRVDG